MAVSPKCRSRFALAASLLFLLADQPALAKSAPRKPPPPQDGVQVYLEVILNGITTNLVAAFVERPNGTLAISVAELAEVGVVSDRNAVGPDGLVELDRLSGATYSYDRVTQTVAVEASPDRLAPHVYRGGGSPSLKKAGQIDGGTGGLLNYTLFGHTDRSFDAGVSAALEGRLFGPYGALTQSGIAGIDERGNLTSTRLDTTFTHSDPDSLITYRMGDLISGGLSWTRPVRMLGFQVSRDFGLRPDLITMPIPTFAGTAAVPSTVDVFANGGRIFSGDVKPGPFTIADLPIVSGTGMARVVVTDALGRQTETSIPFFASSALLAKGLVDLSAEAGLPRLSYGVLSNDYSNDLAGSASLRLGLSDWLTLEAHGEGAKGLLNGGLGVLVPIANHGLASLSAAASLHGTLGTEFGAEFSYDIGRIGLHGRILRTFGDYADIASVNTVAGGPSAAFVGLAKAIDEASLTFPVAGRDAMASLSFTRVAPSFGPPQSLFGVTYSQRLSNCSSLYVTGYRSVAGGKEEGIFVGLSRSLPGGIAATSNLDRVDGRLGGTVDLVKSENPVDGGNGWRLSAGRVGGTTDWLASASYRTEAAHLAASVYGTNADVGGDFEVTGAAAAEGGGVFFANRIDDAFAVVDTGAPGVTVYLENRPAGHTDGSGRLLLPDLRSYQVNKIAIEPDDLPLTADPARTEVAVVPARLAGAVVDFGVATRTDAAIIALRDPAGAVIPPGTPGHLEAGGDFVVGYGGEAYVTGLTPRNVVTLTLDGGRSCQAEFAFRLTGEAQPVMDGVVCQ